MWKARTEISCRVRAKGLGEFRVHGGEWKASREKSGEAPRDSVQ